MELLYSAHDRNSERNIGCSKVFCAAIFEDVVEKLDEIDIIIQEYMSRYGKVAYALEQLKAG